MKQWIEHSLRERQRQDGRGRKVKQNSQNTATRKQKEANSLIHNFSKLLNINILTSAFKWH